MLSANLHADTGTSPADQLISLPIEQLLQYQVDSVSKHSQSISAAPASISIVSAQEIKTHGYRTLGDVLNAMRGLYVTYDRNYTYLGVHGFSTPGDYNTRVLLLVDGVRHNDVVYDQAPIGTDFGIDLDLIARVEFISGPASAIYGANALFGVINVVTKSGTDFRGSNVSVRAGSFGTTRGRATVGDSTANGGSWLLSASRLNQQGQNLFYPEFDTPAQNNGIAEHGDYDRATTLLAKYQQGGFTATLTHGDRTKGIPTASFDQTFNDARAATVDTRTSLSLKYRYPISANLDLVAHLNGGNYEYRGNYVYNDSQLINRDLTHGTWVDGELQAAFTGFERQTLVFGAEYRHAPRVDQKNFDVSPRHVLLDTRQESNTSGFYVQDEIHLNETLTFNLGARLDRLDYGDWVSSPRLGVVWQPNTDTSIKLLHGSAYRAPNAYEQYYYPQFNQASGADSSLNSGLKREHITSDEFVLEQALHASQRVSFSIFRYRIGDLIALRSNPVDDSLFYANAMDMQTRGAELEWQRTWIAGVQLKASYSWQTTEMSNHDPAFNSPRHLIKFNIDGPLGHDIFYGASLRAISTRDSSRGSVPGYGVVDLTLRSTWGDDLEFSASLYNAFDRRYFDPGSSEHVQAALQQDQRNFLVRLDYWF